MRKYWNLFLAGALLAALLVGLCSAETYAEAMTAEELMPLLDEVNDTDSIVSTYGSAQWREVWHLSDGSEEVCTVYEGDELTMAQWDDGTTVVDENGSVYGQNVTDGTPVFYRCVFSGEEAYADFCSDSFSISWYVPGTEYDSAEVSVKASDGGEDGVLILRGMWAMDEESRAAIAEAYGKSAEDILGWEDYWEIEASTMVITRRCTSVLLADGSAILYLEADMLPGAEEPEVPEELVAAVFERENIRTITLVRGGNTDDPMSVSATARADCLFALCVNGETLYTDPDCTQVYTGAEDLGSDMVLFLQADAG